MSIVKRFAKCQSIIPDLYANTSAVKATALADLKTLDKVTHAKAVKTVEQLRYDSAEIIQSY